MQRMVRKQVYIEPEQEALLKRRSADLGVSEAELIRRGIEQIGRAPEPLHPDPEAWQEAKRFIERRMALLLPQIERGWTREDLYEERLGRFSR